MNLENKNDSGMSMSTKPDLQSVNNNIKLELNVKPNRYEKDDYAKMSDGMVP